jgi:hypothetical protein
MVVPDWMKRQERPATEKAERHMPQPDPRGQPRRDEKTTFLGEQGTDRLADKL